MKASNILAIFVGGFALSLPACSFNHAEGHEHGHEGQHKIVATSPEARDVVIMRQYVCQIHSRKHIEVRALEEGYLEEITVNEGQAVKRGDVLFRIYPPLYQARLDAERAEVRLVDIKLKNTMKLFEQKIVSDQEVALHAAELAKAEAKVKQAEAELNFTVVRAPFDGIIDRLNQQQGSLVKKEDLLTTLSDNSVMWVYFNVPEARYLEYMSGRDRENESRQIELQLADGSTFKHFGRIAAIEAKFNNETGNIPFRADFPNPEGLLRHGQTGNVLIRRTLKNAVVIPQRATFEILDKRYVWVVGEDHVIHQRPITVLHELEDIYVIQAGVGLKDRIILEGGQLVHEGEKVEEEFRKPGEALTHQKYHAE